MKRANAASEAHLGNSLLMRDVRDATAELLDSTISRVLKAPRRWQGERASCLDILRTRATALKEVTLRMQRWSF